MEFNEAQMNVITEQTKNALTEFVKSDDFTGAIKEATKSAASEAAQSIVNKAVTSQLKRSEDRLKSEMAELIKEALPVKDEDDPGEKDPKPGETDITKSKAFRDLTKRHDTLSQEMEAERAKREAIEVQAFEKERDANLITIASKANAVDPELIRDALRANVSRDDDGALVVKTTKDGEESFQTTQEVVDSYLKARPFLVKASGTGGAGSSEGSDGGVGGGRGEELDKSTFTDNPKYMAARKAGKIPGVPAAQAPGS